VIAPLVPTEDKIQDKQEWYNPNKPVFSAHTFSDVGLSCIGTFVLLIANNRQAASTERSEAADYES